MTTPWPPPASGTPVPAWPSGEPEPRTAPTPRAGWSSPPPLGAAPFGTGRVPGSSIPASVTGYAPAPRPTAVYPPVSVGPFGSASPVPPHAGYLHQPYPGYPGPPRSQAWFAPAPLPPPLPRSRGVAVVWSLLGTLLLAAAAVVVVVLTERGSPPTSGGGVTTPPPTIPAATTQSSVPTAPRPFPSFTAGGAPGTSPPNDPNDPNELIAAVTPFIDGVNDHDLSAVRAASCRRLADRVRQDDLDPISDMRVSGAVMFTGRVGVVPISYTDEDRGEQQSELSLIIERGEWKVCMS